MTDKSATDIHALSRFLPILEWGKRYDRDTLVADLVAAIIVTIMLIPQSLAYALLAGLPVQMGLYASILPLLAYAIFGTSRVLAVGPVAVVSLMTAAAIGQIAAPGSTAYISAAILLALISGGFLLLLGLFRLGFVANFLSHPVIAGFITASGLLIATSQVGAILGIKTHGHTLVEMLTSLAQQINSANAFTIAVGIASLALLIWVRSGLKPLLVRLGLSQFAAGLIARAGPVAAVLLSILAVWIFGLGDRGVALVGLVPIGLPSLSMPQWDWELVRMLAGPAILISIIGFVESVSVAQTLAARKRQRIVPNQELIGLGAANIFAAFGGGYPVTGGFARSVVNFDAGAETPAAGAYTAVCIALATLFLTPFLALLPKATLSATIIVAVLSLVDFSILKRTWAYSKADFSAVAATILATLLLGVEIGVSTGVALSLLTFLFRSSRPHTAIVGQVPGTEHFRNIDRHSVITNPKIITLRVDESLYFANARFLEDRIYNLVAKQEEAEHFILMCPAVNFIDHSALESLEAINTRLRELNVQFHFSEVKGPVMDRLRRSDFLDHMSGQVFLSQHQAIDALTN